MVDLEFDPASSIMCVEVGIVNDTIVEENEVFSAQLNTSDQQVVLSPDSTTITILDNNG